MITLVRRLLLALGFISSLAPAAHAVPFSTGGGQPLVSYLLLYQGGRVQLYQSGFLLCYSCTTTQSIVSVGPPSLSFVGGVGSAGTTVGTMAAVTNPTFPAFAGTWSFDGTLDASKFRINSSTGVITVGPSDVPNATYNVNVVANGSYTGAPFTQSVVINGSQIASIAPTSVLFQSSAPAATIATEVATQIPPIPPFNGTWSLIGPNANLFNINVNTGALSTVGSTPPGAYSASAVATSPTAGSKTQALTLMAQTISVVSPPSASFVGGLGSAGTFVTTMVATMNPVSPSFSGSWSLSGADANLFSINSVTGVISVGGGDITVGRVYNVVATATPTNSNLTPVSLAVALTGSVTSVSAVALSSTTFVVGSSGTLVGTATVTLSPPGTFTGTLSIVTTGSDHSGTACTANGNSFQFVGANIETNGVVPAGTYTGVCIRATQTGVAPLTQAFTLNGVAGLFNVVQTGSCLSPQSNGTFNSCTIPQTYLHDTVWVGVAFCESASCRTTDTPVSVSASVGSGGACVEVPNARAILSQGGLDGDAFVCPNVAGATNDPVNVTWGSGGASYLNVYALSFYGVAQTTPIEGGNNFDSPSIGNFSISTPAAVTAHDLVVSLGQRTGAVGGTTGVGACTPSTCVNALSALPFQLVEYQVMGSASSVATDAFLNGNTGVTNASIVALKADPNPPTPTPTSISPAAASIASTSPAGAPVATLTCAAGGVICLSPYSMPTNPGGLLTLTGNKLTLTSANPPAGTYTGQVCATWGAGLCETFTLAVGTLTPVSVNCPVNSNVPDNAPSGYVVSTCTVTMSDGSHNFTGTFTPPPTCNVNYLRLSGTAPPTTNVITSRGLSPADLGPFSCTVSATQ